jgi:CCR4-NOT transcriptional regulation complex NOT5 subunit
MKSSEPWVDTAGIEKVKLEISNHISTAAPRTRSVTRFTQGLSQGRTHKETLMKNSSWMRMDGNKRNSSTKNETHSVFQKQKLRREIFWRLAASLLFFKGNAGHPPKRSSTARISLWALLQKVERRSH